MFELHLQKLEKPSQNNAGLYTKETEAILYSAYNKTMVESKLIKHDYVKALQKELSTNISKYETLLLTLKVPVETPAVTQVVAPVEGPAPTAAAVEAAPMADPAAALVVVLF